MHKFLQNRSYIATGTRENKRSKKSTPYKEAKTSNKRPWSSSVAQLVVATSKVPSSDTEAQ